MNFDELIQFLSFLRKNGWNGHVRLSAHGQNPMSVDLSITLSREETP